MKQGTNEGILQSVLNSMEIGIEISKNIHNLQPLQNMKRIDLNSYSKQKPNVDVHSTSNW